MRKIFTFMFALCMTVIANAQTPDASQWTEGQDISKALADLGLWGDYDGTWTAGGYKAKDTDVTLTPYPSPWWKGDQPNEIALDATSDPETNPWPAVGFYKEGANGSLPDMYQVIPLPAGYYTAAVNAVYREGTPADTWTSFNAGNPKRNAHLYVNVLGSNDPESTPISKYDVAIKTLPFSQVHEGLYTGADSGTSWKTDGKWALAHEDIIYYPNCDESAANHFHYYSTETPNGNYYHTVNFILLEDGFIRIGLKKTANISQDWFPWSNMKIFYQGPADEQAQLDLANEKFELAMGELITLQSRIDNEGYIALVCLIEDEMIELSGVDTEDLVAVNEATKYALNIRDQYEAAFASAQSLNSLINMSEDMFVATDFPGKNEFEFAIEAAKEVAFADYVDAVADYKNAFDALSAARAAYLDSQDFDAEGNKDFTMLIKQPWFVNAEYNPEYLPVDGDESNKAWQLTEETWANRYALGNPGNYSNKVGGRTDIASDVVLSADVEATNQWFKKVNFEGWSPGLQLFYQSCLIGPSSGWNSISGGSEEICQQLVGLPEGYYSLKALMRGDNGASWTTPDGVSTFHNIYAMNSAEDVVKSDVNATQFEANNNMSSGWYEWNPLAWTEHKTGVIQVPDGKLLIAAQTTNVMNATGFRLYFHGESPEFDKMIQTDIDAVNAKYEALAFAGDKKHVKDLLDQIVLPIGIDAALYEANMALIKEADKYITTVNDYMKNYKAVENFTALQGGYAEGTDQFAILDVPFQYVLALGEKDTETYEDAQLANVMYAAYAEYMPVYDKALKYKNDEIAKLLADQTAYLKANMADPALLSEYVAALSIPTNVEMIKQLGGETASEENPLDITSLLKNPTFVDTSGWEGTSISQNEYARNNAEIWNQTTFDFYQAIPYMPAGKYKVTAQALYRDGAGSSDLAECYQTWLDCGQDKNEWANHNAYLYVLAGGRMGMDYVTSVCDTKNTELSFSDYFDFSGDAYTIGDYGRFLLYEELSADDKAIVDAEGRENWGFVYNPEGDALGQYPFDGRVDIYDADSTEIQLFFPESMAGAALRFQKGDYPCEAIVNAFEDGTLQVGINKNAGVSGDWVVFANFKLYYLGEPEDETTPEPNPAANLIADDESYNFNNGTVGQWHYLAWNNSGTATVVVPGYEESAGTMALTSLNPAGDPWGAQLQCPLKEGAKLEIGKTYTVSFWAKGTEEGDYFNIGAGTYPDPEWNNAEPAVLTTSWKQYTYTLECTGANTAANGTTVMYINHGKLTGTAYIDRFMVYNICSEINPDGNLIVDDESFAFNGGTTGNWKMGEWNNRGTATAVAPGWNGSEYCMELAPNGSAGQNYEAQLPYNLETPMKVGETYKVSFYAKAENEGAEIEFGAQYSPWSAGNKDWNGNMVALTTDWALYELELMVTDDYPADGLNCVYFNYGTTNGKVYIDHIVIINTVEQEDETILGDVNRDHIVSVTDAAAAVNIILNKYTEGLDNKAADIDGDGNVSIIDVAGIINIILTGNSAPQNVKSRLETENEKSERHDDNTNVLTLSDVTLTPGAQQRVLVGMNNNSDITAIQFDLQLPDGVTVAESFGDYMIDLSAARTSVRNHNVSYQPQADGTMRVVCTSNGNKVFAGNSGTVMEFCLNVSDDFNSDGKEIILSNIELATPSLEKYNPMDVRISVSGATGIDFVSHSITSNGRYNLKGQLVNKDYKGIVIENGKKVYNK